MPVSLAAAVPGGAGLLTRMISATSLQRIFGIKASETRTVGLFLLHNFLLGIGSVLVYVASNVLLL
ncbi:MAG: hypothetical protein JWR44_3302 [Hymenobacter sp.]|nr:hypothetical protein [Hymenobacter sp.]